MKRILSPLAIVVVAALAVVLGAPASEAQEASRYPYDPVCPWGRLSNGKGMLVRCISQDEAAALSGKTASAPPRRSATPAPSASLAPASGASSAPGNAAAGNSETGKSPAPAPGTSSAPGDSPPGNAAPGNPAPSGNADSPREDPLKTYVLRSIKVTADQGKLPGAEKRLAGGKDKMLECLGKHGGLEKQEGEAHVRFLVSARGRAEGVSVSKRVAMSAAAADCIAHVVDRRPVGIPEAPMTGATAVIRLARVMKE